MNKLTELLTEQFNTLQHNSKDIATLSARIDTLEDSLIRACKIVNAYKDSTTLLVKQVNDIEDALAVLIKLSTKTGVINNE